MTPDIEWKEIPSAPRYFASNLGAIRGPSGKILKPFLRNDGYTQITVHIASRQTVIRVHGMICEAFHGNRPTPCHVVAHGDGVRSNNRPSNLRWATPSENKEDMKFHGTWPKGDAHPRATLTRVQADEIRALYREEVGENRVKYRFRQEMVERYGVSLHIVKDILADRSWTDAPRQRKAAA